MADYDVVVVGAGNAAAVSAREQGARRLAVLEKARELFQSNYPGGTGLMSGAVFGRIAGASAAGA